MNLLYLIQNYKLVMVKYLYLNMDIALMNLKINIYKYVILIIKEVMVIWLLKNVL